MHQPTCFCSWEELDDDLRTSASASFGQQPLLVRSEASALLLPHRIWFSSACLALVLRNERVQVDMSVTMKRVR